MALFNNAIRIGEDGAGTDDAELVNALVSRNMKFEETLRYVEENREAEEEYVSKILRDRMRR